MNLAHDGLARGADEKSGGLKAALFIHSPFSILNSPFSPPFSILHGKA
jgi:hypothetical protein